MSESAHELVRSRAYEISVEPGAGTPEENWLRAERELTVVHDYDTPDLDLEHAGLEVSRVPLEAGVLWRLTLPLGEQVEIWTSGTEGIVLPDQIMQLISGVVGEKPLIPAPPLGSDPGAARLRELLREQRLELLAHEPGVRLGADPENLHNHRVAARRSHAFLRSLRRYVDPEWLRTLTLPLSELAAVTGPVRDLDVLLEHVHGELAMLGPQDQASGGSLVARLELARDAARQPLIDALNGASYHTLLGRLRLPPRLAIDVEAIPLKRVARKEFDRLANLVGQLGKHPDETALHELRIALKRARYAAELSAPAGKRGKRFFAHAKALQDLLGEYQDAAIAEQRLRATTVVDAPTEAAFIAGRLIERQRARRDQVTRQLPAAWKRLRKSAVRLGSRG